MPPHRSITSQRSTNRLGAGHRQPDSPTHDKAAMRDIYEHVVAVALAVDTTTSEGRYEGIKKDKHLADLDSAAVTRALDRLRKSIIRTSEKPLDVICRELSVERRDWDKVTLMRAFVRHVRLEEGTDGRSVRPFWRKLDSWIADTRAQEVGFGGDVWGRWARYLNEVLHQDRLERPSQSTPPLFTNAPLAPAAGQGKMALTCILNWD
ncbi:hypothetical protein C8R46DRAFT_1222196 [Mycena filopes]|nr:hypothetical protein C8R46DRAFT_1222196 [Mycena filopes]